jgi:tRNA A37 threonylcarbamoyltransferase TsaD
MTDLVIQKDIIITKAITATSVHKQNITIMPENATNDHEKSTIDVCEETAIKDASLGIRVGVY